MTVTDYNTEHEGFWGHVIELRRRFIIYVCAFILLSLLAYVFSDDIYAFLVAPLADQVIEGEGRRLIYTGLAEAFLTYLKLAFYVGFLASLPVALYQIWRFIAPGLYKEERRAILPFFLFSPVLFAAGIVMAYEVILPIAWNFFMSFEQPAQSGGLPIVLEARVGEYLSMTLTLLMAFGFAFQLPVILSILSRLNIIDASQLKRWRKYAVLLCLVCAAFLTPPDIISQVALAVPMYVLYEVSILIAALGHSKNQNQHPNNSVEPIENA